MVLCSQQHNTGTPAARPSDVRRNLTLTLWRESSSERPHAGIIGLREVGDDALPLERSAEWKDGQLGWGLVAGPVRRKAGWLPGRCCQGKARLSAEGLLDD